MQISSVPRRLDSSTVVILVLALVAMMRPSLAFEPGWPMSIEHILSSSFCEWRGSRLHSGIDFKTRQRTGMPVMALEDGWVSRVKVEKRGYGRALYISHPSGHVTVFGHLERFMPGIEERVGRILRKKNAKWGVDISPGKGDFPVKKGQVVAWSGETGAGPAHLHVEIRKGMGIALDPQDFGLRPPDTIPPEILAIILEPISGQTLLNGEFGPIEIPLVKSGPGIFKAPGKVSATGPFLVKARMVERADGADNRMGAKQIGLAVDGREIFRARFDSMSFTKNHLGGLVHDFTRPGFSGGGLTYYLLSLPMAPFPNLHVDSRDDRGDGMGMTVIGSFGKSFDRNRREWLISWNAAGDDGAVETWRYPWGDHLLTVTAVDPSGNGSAGSVEVTFDRPPEARSLGAELTESANRIDIRFAVMDPDVSCPPLHGRRAASTEEMMDLVEIHGLDDGGEWKNLESIGVWPFPGSPHDSEKGVSMKFSSGVFELGIPAGIESAKLSAVKVRVRDSAGLFSSFMTPWVSGSRSSGPGKESNPRRLNPDFDPGHAASLGRHLEDARIVLNRRGEFLHGVLILPDSRSTAHDTARAVASGVRMVAAPSLGELKSVLAAGGISPLKVSGKSSGGKTGAVEVFAPGAGCDPVRGITFGTDESSKSGKWSAGPASETSIGRFEATIPLPESLAADVPVLFVLDGPGILIGDPSLYLKAVRVSPELGGSLSAGDGGFSVAIPPGAPLGDMVLSVNAARPGGKRGLKGVSRIYRPEPWGIPFDKPVEITMALPPEAGGRERQAGIYSGSGSGWSCEGGTVSDGKISVSQRNLESGYMIFLDESPPSIKGLKIKKTGKTGRYEVRAMVSDLGEGLDDSSFVLTVAGKKIDWDFDPDKALIVADIPRDLVKNISASRVKPEESSSGPGKKGSKKGKGKSIRGKGASKTSGPVVEVVLKVCDRAGNSTVAKISGKL